MMKSLPETAGDVLDAACSVANLGQSQLGRPVLPVAESFPQRSCIQTFVLPDLLRLHAYSSIVRTMGHAG